MIRVAATIIVVFGLVIILAKVLSELADSQAAETRARAELVYERGQAEATIMRAQGQARLDAAQAGAITMSAALPWGVLGTLGLLGLALSALAMAIVVMSFNKAMQPPPIVERQIILLPGPDTARRDVWRLMAGEQPKPLYLRSGRKAGRQ